MIRSIGVAALSALLLFTNTATPSLAADRISVDVFKGEVATVNSFIFSNGKSLIVMDVQRATSEAKKLEKVIKAKGLPLTHILVTHGHPDHYTGMRYLSEAFPKAEIVVATAKIKADIKGFSTWMESVGWLDKEPGLKPKTAKNPNGFDYDGKIRVLQGNKLTFGIGDGALTLDTDHPAAESDHSTTVYVKDLNALFASDWAYNKVHLWMGSGVTDKHVANWRAHLVKLKERYASRNPTIYPGHGDKADIGLLDTLVKYIDNFRRIVASAKSKQEAMAKMKSLYKGYAEAGFLLKYSVDEHFKK